ncbi:MAG TPA: DUF1737 domain-containing protein [Verrucomicrobiae bacterium]|jgi:hypothetical protein|nr:DUF1737 domain-containing protein [Verrucomicrobiae bacterium]
MTKKKREITEYELIGCSESTELSREVSKKLAEGWSLYGSPFYADYGLSDHKAFFQAVTRKNNAESP